MTSDNRKERDHILDVDHLSMHFTTKKRGKTSVVKAVDDVSFYVERGETFGLVGTPVRFIIREKGDSSTR